MWDNPMTKVLLIGIWESFYMTILSTIFAYILGTPLGIILVMSGKDGIRPRPVLFKILDVIVNITRSIPFLILMISITPLTRFIMGTQLGSKATIVPLVLAATPFIARMVESSLLEIDRGIIEAAHSMGASNFEIIFKVMLPEAIPSLINGATIAVTTILGYSASAGVMGGGGLGTIAINYGYNRNQEDIMLITIILLIIMVQIFQEIGMRIAGVSDKRKS